MKVIKPWRSRLVMFQVKMKGEIHVTIISLQKVKKKNQETNLNTST